MVYAKLQCGVSLLYKFINFRLLVAAGQSKLAVRLFAPNAWTKLHDHAKVYGGYARFVTILSMVAARAIYWQDLFSSRAPSFNLSAGLAACCFVFTELLEDLIVLREWLPESPIPKEVLKEHQKFDNTHPSQLLAVQWQAEDAFADPDDVWHCNELDGKGARRTSFMAESVSFMPTSEVVEKRVALGHREEGVHARLREWLGQPRGVTPCPALHGLREFSVAAQRDKHSL